jgi:uncharacterized protein YdeI (YjbR/CyaY-like superfamily)
VFLFANLKEWEDWLEKNHGNFRAIWVKFAKKNSGTVSITYDEALRGALCYGWIDGLINKYDNSYYLTRFSPRKPVSIWSKINRELAEKLILEGKMQPSGLAAIEAAKANGRWHTAYDSSKTMQVPEDFFKELAEDKKAEEFFRSLNKANTYAIAWRLQTAKNPETREKRKKMLLEMMKKGEKLH